MSGRTEGGLLPSVHVDARERRGRVERPQENVRSRERERDRLTERPEFVAVDERDVQ